MRTSPRVIHLSARLSGSGRPADSTRWTSKRDSANLRNMPATFPDLIQPATSSSAITISPVRGEGGVTPGLTMVRRASLLVIDQHVFEGEEERAPHHRETGCDAALP